MVRYRPTVWNSSFRLGKRLQKLLVLIAVTAADDASESRRRGGQTFEPEPPAAVTRTPIGRLVRRLQLLAIFRIERLGVAHRGFLRDVVRLRDEVLVRI